MLDSLVEALVSVVGGSAVQTGQVQRDHDSRNGERQTPADTEPETIL